MLVLLRESKRVQVKSFRSNNIRAEHIGQQGMLLDLCRDELWRNLKLLARSIILVTERFEEVVTRELLSV
jgi:hypothetical protein